VSYRVELRPAAVRALRKVHPDDRGRIQGASPCWLRIRDPGSRALQGRPGLWVRVGDHRISYTVEDDVLLVVVVTPGQRRDAYRR
jgi:mRNA interferase RelE/StbE